MAYSKTLMDKIETIYIYYEEHDCLAVLQRIMLFIRNCIELIDETLLPIDSDELNQLKSRAREILQDDASPEKLNAIGFEYQNKVFSVKPFKELILDKQSFATFRAFGYYFSNHHNDPTNQFVHDFIELFVDNLHELEIPERFVEKIADELFGDIY